MVSVSQEGKIQRRKESEIEQRKDKINFKQRGGALKHLLCWKWVLTIFTGQSHQGILGGFGEGHVVFGIGKSAWCNGKIPGKLFLKWKLAWLQLMP